MRKRTITTAVVLVLAIVLSAMAGEGAAYGADDPEPKGQPGEEALSVAEAHAPDGASIGITDVNRPIRAADELILFTREHASDKTDGNAYSAAVTAEYFDGKYTVTDVKARVGAVSIPTNGFVLFGHGTSEQWLLEHLKAGDEVTVTGIDLPGPVDGRRLQLEDGSSVNVDGVDEERSADGVTLYTSAYGTSTPPYGADTAEYIVTGDTVAGIQTDGAKGTFIPANGYVISASGAARALLASVEVGQTVRALNLDIPILPERYAQIRDIVVPIDDVNGVRDANEVVLYLPDYGATTGTNAWGMELTVVNDVVTNIVGFRPDPANPGGFLDNNSPIPADGYVISVQIGSAAYAALNGKVAVGDGVKLVLDNQTLYKAAKSAYDAVNPKTREDNPGGYDEATNTPYPGLRGPDQLIVYDGGYGQPSTGTNPWGLEVTVNADGKVVSIGGNDSAIPDGGLVLSGHGAQATWLAVNAQIGATVRVNRVAKTVLLLFTPESYLDKAEIGFANIGRELAASRERFLDVPYGEIENRIAQAEQAYAEAEAHLRDNGVEGLSDILNRLERFLNEAGYMNVESRGVEHRGLWLRPKEQTVEQVREHLTAIKALNINAVYLETWWDGFTAFPTDNPLTGLNPIYNGFDVLGAYIEEGKKLGIEIHAWVENFFVGGNKKGPVLEIHPEWTMLSRKGDPYESSAGSDFKYYYLNPALPEARDFVSSVYKELLTKYDVAGLHLDYTRYPGAGDYTNDHGYEPYTRELFKSEYGADPLDLHPGDALWETWLEFKIGIINTWVDRVVAEARAIKPDLSITAAVWPNFESAPVLLAQRAKDWVDKGYIDTLFHMSYHPDASLVVEDARKTLAVAGGKSLSASGVGTFIGLTKEELARQIAGVNAEGLHGSALFEFESLFAGRYGDILKPGVYRNEAVFPAFGKTAPYEKLFEEMERKIDDIYVPFGGMPAKSAKKLEKQLEKLKSALDRDGGALTAKTARKLENELGKLRREIESDRALHAEVKLRMTADLKLAEDLLGVYQSR